MKRLGELDNIQRLYEIKENVMKSQKDMTKQFNDSVIGCLAGFAKTVWEKGIEGLEEETSIGSVKKFVFLVKNGSFLVRIQI